MLFPQLEQQLNQARQALKRASSENIVELCKEYLLLLAQYRGKLYELSETSGIGKRPAPSSPLEDIGDTRKAIRAAIENTTRERNSTEMLLVSFTTVSGYQAVEVF